MLLLPSSILLSPLFLLNCNNCKCWTLVRNSKFQVNEILKLFQNNQLAASCKPICPYYSTSTQSSRVIFHGFIYHLLSSSSFIRKVCYGQMNLSSLIVRYYNTETKFPLIKKFSNIADF